MIHDNQLLCRDRIGQGMLLSMARLIRKPQGGDAYLCRGFSIKHNYIRGFAHGIYFYPAKNSSYTVFGQSITQSNTFFDITSNWAYQTKFLAGAWNYSTDNHALDNYPETT